MRISSQDAQIMKSGSARFPMKGTNCVPSCAFYFCCANGKDGENCTGFQLLNGESKKLLERNLGEDSVKYIENSYGFIERAIQNKNFDGVEVVTRDLSRLREKAIPEPTQRPEGFLYMLKCARGVQNTSPQKSQPIERSQLNQHQEGILAMIEASRGLLSTSSRQPEPDPVECGHENGFAGMIDALRSKTQSNPNLTRAIDETQFPNFCDPMKCPPNFSRHCSANRPENYGRPCIYQTSTNEKINRPETQQRIAKSTTLLKIVHVIPNRPNFCKTKNPNGLDEQ